jgi:hypothetical protein
MAKNFQELRAGMSAEANAASATEHRHLMEEIKLHQLRQARELTQTKIARKLHTGRAIQNQRLLNANGRQPIYASSLCQELRTA